MPNSGRGAPPDLDQCREPLMDPLHTNLVFGEPHAERPRNTSVFCISVRSTPEPATLYQRKRRWLRQPDSRERARGGGEEGPGGKGAQ
jgi:hypothetical protein